MASGSLQYPFPGGAPLPPYQQLKEEQELSSPVAPTVVHMGPQVYAAPVRDHIVWSFFTAMYLNFCCFGAMALAFSVKARDCKVIGDQNRASSYGSTAKWLNITALILSLLMFIVVVIVVVFVTSL